VSRNIPIRIPEDDALADEAPDFFTGVKFSVDEILMGTNVLVAKARDLAGSLENRQPVSLKLAADDIHKFASEVSILAGVVARVATTHVNRRSRT
jgi:hypothetical protein